MRRTTVLLAILTTSVFSNTEFKFAKNYFHNGGVNTAQIQKIMNDDIYFQNGNQFLQNPSMMSNVTVDTKDPEDKNAPSKMVQTSLPNWPKALEQFKKSVELHNNPVSAYQGLHIIKTAYGKNYQLKYFSSFSEVLYNNEKNICEAYIDFGETLEKGYYRKKDLKRAYQVYTEGLEVENCKKGWHLNILSAKQWNLRKYK